MHSRLYGHPKIYLQYDGSMRSDKIVGKRDAYFCDRYARPFYLVHYNDLGREYDPVGDEPKYFVLGDVFKEYVTYLENVIKQIQ